jgi:hypothetical protein
VEETPKAGKHDLVASSVLVDPRLWLARLQNKKK